MTSKKPSLRAVTPDEVAPKRPDPKNISEALSGTGTDVLVAMRKALAKKLDDDSIASNAIASAYKELRELDRLIRVAEREATESVEENASRDVDTAFDASAI